MDARGVSEVFVGLGSNLGDREAHLRGAAERLGRLADGENAVMSSLYETSPVGGPPQGWYLNAVVRLASTRSPRALLDACLEIERDAGRVRTVRDAPRVLDLDLLLVADQVVSETTLRVPHPELHRRRFVLVPLAELAPARIHPVLGRTIAELLADLDLDLEAGPDVVRPYRP